MIPFIGPEFSDYLFEDRSESEQPLGMPLLATGHPHDEDRSRHLVTDDDEISGRQVWPEIRYLDSARSRQNKGEPVAVPVIAHVLTWTIVLAALLSLVI